MSLTTTCHGYLLLGGSGIEALTPPKQVMERFTKGLGNAASAYPQSGSSYKLNSD